MKIYKQKFKTNNKYKLKIHKSKLKIEEKKNNSLAVLNNICNYRLIDEREFLISELYKKPQKIN